MNSEKMKKLIFILTTLLPQLTWGQLAIQPQATLFVGDEATLSVGTDVNNDGSLQNLGFVSFTNNWTNTNIYNDGDNGELEANGPGSQTISNNDQAISTLTVNSGVELTFLANTVEIMQELRLTNGIVRLGDGASLVINQNAAITGGSENSFVDGAIIQKGGGNRFYPLGVESFYMPIEFLNIQNTGTDLEMSVRVGLFSDAGVSPRPTGSVIGVSDYHYWEITEINGSFFADGNGPNGSIVTAEFDNANISPTAFGSNINDFTRVASTVGLVQSAALDGDFARVDGELDENNTDFVENTSGGNSTGTATFGVIDTVDPINQMFVGVGLVAASNPEGVMFVPTAFSPSAINPEDQTLRAFGDNVQNTPFTFAVYNSFGVEVYRANDLDTAMNTGWDGINQKNGKEEPMGSYRYFVQYRNNEERDFKESGVVLLIR